MLTISQLIQFHGIQQAELARQLEVAENTVFRWCSGERVPRPADAYRIGDIFNMMAVADMDGSYRFCSKLRAKKESCRILAKTSGRQTKETV